MNKKLFAIAGAVALAGIGSMAAVAFVLSLLPIPA